MDRRLIGSKSLKLNEFLMTLSTVLVLDGSVSIIWDTAARAFVLCRRTEATAAAGQDEITKSRLQAAFTTCTQGERL
ncbi:hypothetical protein [Paraburkholderia sp. 22B1P]|uniref:hypothetical protein n=1 Tax=Paraburkholderia sp. 22B1P TaxID=3080498 RepID=UPI0030D0B794